MTTNMRSGVSNIRSKFTTPGWCKFCKIWTSFFNAASCFVGNLFFSITYKKYILILINFTKNISCEIDFTKFWWTYFDCHSVTWFPVNPTINNTKLTRTQNFIRENLVGFWNIFFFLVRLFRSAIKFRYLF